MEHRRVPGRCPKQSLDRCPERGRSRGPKQGPARCLEWVRSRVPDPNRGTMGALAGVLNKGSAGPTTGA